MEENKKAPVAIECLSAFTSCSGDVPVDSKNLFSEAYSIKSMQELQAELEKEVTQKFTPKKQKSLELAERYDDISKFNRVADSDGCIKSTYISDKYLRKSAKVQSCGSYLEFHQFPDKNRLYMANFCKDRLCPLCNWRRSMKIFGQLSEIIQFFKSSGEYQNLQFVFLTLTIKNMPAGEFPQAISDLLQGWRNLYHENKAFKNGTICGTFRTLEITYNEGTNEFHPHLHVILAVRPSYFKHDYISQKKWSEIWKACMKIEYVPIVFIEKTFTKSSNISASDVGSVTAAFLEVAKYAAKDSDYLQNSDVTQVFSEALENRQLVGFTGCFAKVRKQLGHDDAEDGNLVNTTSELEPEVAYTIVKLNWVNGVYRKV